ncbi:MAG: CobD/CbiB family protein [Sulfurimicrobium sp.]
MSFLALLTALLLDYFQPLPSHFRAYPWFSRYVRYLEHQFNAGSYRHGLLAWLLAVMPLTVLVTLGYLFLSQLNTLLGWLWSVAVLYLIVGFRCLGVNAAAIATALRSQNLDEARRQLGQWLARDTAALSGGEIARLGIEEVLRSAYQQLFGVIIWFVLFGPGGAILYRLSQILGLKWGELDEREFGDFGKVAARVLAWMEWIPLRITAISFAIVGDFEDAMYCWRSQAGQWAQHGMGVILASGAGAMGVKLGESIPGRDGIEIRPELGLGDEADADYLDSAVSMVWRALALWLVLLLLLTLARWTGS